MRSGPACPACGNERHVHRESINEYDILDCADCRLVFCDPMKGGDEAYYQHHIVYDRVSEVCAAQQLTNCNNRANRNLLQGLPPGSRTLDIGCGYGALVALAHRRGLDAYGIDFNAHQIAIGRQVYQLHGRLQVGRIEELPELYVEGRYDLVTLFEVIEHVEEPRKLIDQVRRLLKPGGLLALSCPNEARWQPAGRIFVDYPPHHLTRWRPNALMRLLHEFQFTDIRVRKDASFRDIVWTAFVNHAAKHRTPGRSADQMESAPASTRNWKHKVFDFAGVVLAPADLILRTFGIGTMGMRVFARKSG